MPMYPRTTAENLVFRAQIINSLKENAKARAEFIALIDKDIKVFFDLCLWTYDTRTLEKHLPFILYPYQSDYIETINDCIARGEDHLTDKTRDMGVSWMILGVFYYRWARFNESFLIGSEKEDKVDTLGDIDSHFERLRYLHKFIEKCYPFLIDGNVIKNGFMNLAKDNGAVIAGESMNENFSRQGRYNAILLDEFAHVRGNLGETVWTATGDSTPCRLPVSTPKGKRNKFGELRFSGKIKVSSLPWTLHPKKTQTWYDRESQRRGITEMAQEIDISYTASQGKPFYAGFKRHIHCIEAKLNPYKEIITGWDFGYHHPCMVVLQLDDKGRLVWHDTLFGTDIQIEDYSIQAQTFLNLYYPKYPHRDFGDPAGDQKSDKTGERSSIVICNENGFNIKYLPTNRSDTNYRARKILVERHLNRMIDGIPSLVVAKKDRNEIVMEGFEGGYRYPDANNYGREPEEPLRDGYYEHVFNAFEMVMLNLFTVRTKEEPVKQPNYTYRHPQKSRR